MKLSFAALAALIFIVAFEPPAKSQQTIPAECTKLCVQVIQAIGDDIKAQIPMSCDQFAGTCTASGTFVMGDQQVPVTLSAELSGDTVDVKISGDGVNYGPADAEDFSIELAPAQAWQAQRFDVYRLPARNNIPVAITIVVNRVIG